MSAAITHASGPGRPCPVCGRTADSDCRWGDALILCHQGQRHAPPNGLRIGDTLLIDGRLWALVRVGGGFDGAAAVFKPHQPRQAITSGRPAPLRAAVPDAAPITSSSARRLMEAVLELADEAFDAPDFHLAHPDILWPALHSILRGEQLARRAAVVLSVIWRTHPDLAAIYRVPVQAALRDLGYQADDVRRFRRYDLGEGRHEA